MRFCNDEKYFRRCMRCSIAGRIIDKSLVISIAFWSVGIVFRLTVEA